ncbi:MAG: hypothetical protein HY735_03675 [Verrucomicrobia bacterium]|nr:hypothetical protein [Verrucomicrobiota bacterium]
MNNLHQILLQPTDVLFFRDGRPMSGSLAGHTAAWPLPDVTNHALHAALHRAGLEQETGVKLHRHAPGRSSDKRDHSDENRAKHGRLFGSLLTAGPFPVREKGGKATWFFPRPKDAQLNGSVAVTLCPVISLPGVEQPWQTSSLATPPKYAVANSRPPAKDAGGESWISTDAFNSFLRGSDDLKPDKPGDHFLRDTDIADTEYAIGIGIDPETQTQDKTNFYSAHYLRLREEFRLGLFAEAMDKEFKQHNSDLLQTLLNGQPQNIIVGGQQRLCTAHRRNAPQPLPLPKGLHAAVDFKPLPNGKFPVKWALLTPALWPEIPPAKKDGSPQNPHPGGWLPNWVFVNWDSEKREARFDERGGQVLLTTGSGLRKAKRKGGAPGSTIPARLVAAIVPKPIIVTGWSLAESKSENQKSEIPSGAKSTHLAVSAGAVYYFEAEPDKDGGPAHALALANALNWHGSGDGSKIQNRRSTLLGEKGYGLGVCGTWRFYGE